MANTSLKIGGNNWAVKEDNLLGYNVIQNKYVPIEIDTVMATTATRVNENGLIEVVPKNLLSYSEQFDNAIWVKTNATVTANSTISPNGSLTADTLSSVLASDNTIIQTTSISLPTTYVFSIFIKKDNNENRFPEIFFRLYGGTIVDQFVQLNTKTGDTTVRASSGSVSHIVQSVGDYWRISLASVNVSNTTCRITIRPAATDVFGTYNPQIGSIIAWGAQLEANSTATDYFPTTDRLNIPRIDYSSGEASLLVEGQRSNLFTKSYEFDSANWIKNNLSVTANATTSPDGTSNAELLDDGISASTQHWIYQNPSFANSTSYTISLYVKYVSRRFISINMFNGVGSQQVYYDVENGLISGSTGDVTASIISAGNGWYRISYTRSTAASGTPNLRIALADNSPTITYTGSNKQMYIYGAQLEAGSYATSYIPTVATAVTRNQDVISKTGISGLIGQTEGTMFIEANSFQTNVNRYISISDGTSNNYVYLRYIDSSNQIWFRIASNGVVGSVQTYTYTNPQNFIKTAIRYNNNSFDVFLNGVKIITSVGVNTLSGSMNQLKFSFPDNTNIFQGNAKTLALYKTALTDQECINLTTL